MKVEIEKIHENAQIPQYMTENSAGADICSCEQCWIPPHSAKLVKTGLKMAVPHGYEIQIRPRSGLALKQGVTVLNTPGTIDSDYRGEVGVILYNINSAPFLVKQGMRIAQMVINEIHQSEFDIVEKLDETQRGAGGFGHTGI